MSTFSEQRDYRWQTYTRSNNQWNLSGTTLDRLTEESRTYPDSVYRKPPGDLFANGTARSTSSTFIRTTLVDQVLSNGTTWHVGQPAYLRMPAVASKTLLPASDFGALRNVVRKKVRQDAVNLAMALAEYRKTAEMYGALSRAVASRGKSLASAVKQRAGVSKAWLAFQYGVKPHVSDILGSLDAISKRLNHPVYISGVESRRENAIEFERRRLNATYNSHWANIEFHQTRRIRCQWRAQINTNAIQNVLVRHGFANPFALAYELIPYSFVLDWWINVGDVLASLDNLLLISDLKVIESYSTVTARFVNGEGATSGRDSVTPYSWSLLSRSDVRRAPISISTIATLRYKPSVSLTHIANGLALAHVARRRFP